ncbi:unnamed protein product [marine sediment metagenome]|uniref:Uncharacterized protein n=1 Tax=marine sediment metagenome TaxID=412755 RepID=X0TDY9_9ZZZZ
MTDPFLEKAKALIGSCWREDEFNVGDMADKIASFARDSVREERERRKQVFCVLTSEINWNKPEGSGFIYRNLLGVYKTVEQAHRLIERFTCFVGGDWKRVSESEYNRGNNRISILELDPNKDDQIFDHNH